MHPGRALAFHRACSKAGDDLPAESKYTQRRDGDEQDVQEEQIVRRTGTVLEKL
jgi:hypothetical protein